MIGKYPQELIRRSKATGKTERWLLKEDVLGLIDESVDWYKTSIKSMGIGEARRFCVDFKKHLEELKARIKG